MTDDVLAAYIRGYTLREVGKRKMIRWAVWVLVNLWSTKKVSVESLMKFEDEAKPIVSDKEKLQQMEEVFKKWDNNN